MADQVLEKKANWLRGMLGLSANDCLSMNSLLLKLDVLTVFKELGDGFSGMAIRVGEPDTQKRFILVNSTHPVGKQHFTICHELYHLFIQENFTSRICNTGKFNRNGDIEEYHADVFASFFLLPQAGLECLIPDNEFKKNKISLATILKIEQTFTCSRTALLYRLKTLGIIDGTGYELFNKNIMRSALTYGYSIDLYKAGNHNKVIGDYGTVARALFEKEKISESHYLSLLLDLGMNTEEVERLSNGEEED